MVSMTSILIFLYEFMLLMYYDNPFNTMDLEEAMDKIDKRSKK